MSKENLFSFSIKYKTETELYSQVVRCYNLICNKNLTDRQVSTLVFYLKYGFSRKTKKMLKDDLGVEDNHVNVINHHLRLKGVLVKDEWNENKSRLSDEVLKIKDFVENGDSKKFIPILFTND